MFNKFKNLNNKMKTESYYFPACDPNRFM